MKENEIKIYYLNQVKENEPISFKQYNVRVVENESGVVYLYENNECIFTFLAESLKTIMLDYDTYPSNDFLSKVLEWYVDKVFHVKVFIHHYKEHNMVVIPHPYNRERTK